jgi:hypothetical protein
VTISDRPSIGYKTNFFEIQQVNQIMINAIAKITLPLLLVSAVIANDDIEGAYERVSLTNTRTGESPEAANRQGLLILAHGHYSMMTMNPDRRVLDGDQKLEDMSQDEQIAFLQEWLDVNAHSGRYQVDGNALTWYRDISENPREVGTTSRLNFEQGDDLLIISFALPNGDIYHWTWRRVD